MSLLSSPTLLKNAARSASAVDTRTNLSEIAPVLASVKCSTARLSVVSSTHASVIWISERELLAVIPSKAAARPTRTIASMPYRTDSSLPLHGAVYGKTLGSPALFPPNFSTSFGLSALKEMHRQGGVPVSTHRTGTCNHPWRPC